MLRIDEWKAPDWTRLVWSEIPPQPGQRPQSPPGTGAPAAPGLASQIGDRLELLRRRPHAVHFYTGEGLRWIRVGFAGARLAPPAVGDVGRAIAPCVGGTRKLYFHALRPHDLLFFLPGTKSEAAKTGMPMEYFGDPLASVLRSWRL
jgi:hypothetical protein